MQDKPKQLHIAKNTDFLKKQKGKSFLNQLDQQELKKLDFNKAEYDYFMDSCNFTDRQKEILDLRRKGLSIVAISFRTYLSERTIYRELKAIKRKIRKLI